MKRREFVSLVGGAAAWPLAARAQQRGVPVIGLLHPQSPDAYRDQLVPFYRALKEAGYVEGQTVALEYRWAHNQLDQLPELAADLVRRRVAVIVVPGGGIATALAAKGATATIPIVVAAGYDPIRSGLVASLNRPGGNVTGISFLTVHLAGKRLEVLRQLLPRATTVAFLADGQAEEQTNVRAAGIALGWQVIVQEARSDRDLELDFSTLKQRGVNALTVGSGPFLANNRRQIIALAARHNIPAIYQSRNFAVDGGLISYGTSLTELYHLLGTYAAQILNGAKPAELPVQRSTRFELVINLKTAKTLGVDIPATLFAIADEVIE
jgi:putative ABC transport system substrate-binding protein